MAEAPKSPRKPEEIQAEFVQTCARAGELQYNIQEAQKDLSLMNSRIRDMKLEFAQAQEFSAKVAAEVAAQNSAKNAENDPPDSTQSPAPDNVTPLKTEDKSND